MDRRLFCRLFFVNAAASVLLLRGQGGKRLLTVGTQAPDFTAGGLSLRQYRDRNRVIVVFDPPGAYLGDVAAHRRPYEDRDLVVLAFVSTGMPDFKNAPPFVHVLRDANGAATLYHADGKGTVFSLIGKDGTIKIARHDIPSDEELFAVIDAMPMRRHEVRERGR